MRSCGQIIRDAGWQEAATRGSNFALSEKERAGMDKSIGQYIRERREQFGISLRGFAKILSISPTYLSDLELGRRTITRRLTARIAWEISQRLLEIDPSAYSDNGIAWLSEFQRMAIVSNILPVEYYKLMDIRNVIKEKGKAKDKLRKIEDIVRSAFYDDYESRL